MPVAYFTNRSGIKEKVLMILYSIKQTSEGVFARIWWGRIMKRVQHSPAQLARAP